MQESTTVRFRYGTPVTSNYPEVIPGSFIFDSSELCLYLDTSSGRHQVVDPLKLSLTGGTLTGTVEVVDAWGTVVASFSKTGTVSGLYLQTTGNISMPTAPNLYAVVDENGRIRTRTRDEMITDLNIFNPDLLGTLAYKDSATGVYTPIGTITPPEVTVNYDTQEVVGTVSTTHYEVFDEVLTLTEVTHTTTEVMKSITSVDVTTPTFTGETATITVQ